MPVLSRVPHIREAYVGISRSETAFIIPLLETREKQISPFRYEMTNKKRIELTLDAPT